MINIMIIDDEALFRDYLLNAIRWEYYGFKVVCEARNGVDALEKIKEYQVDIALVDICMPFMDGIELSKHLKNINPQIEIIIITGQSEFEYAKQAIKLGVSDYILKPFDKEELILTLLKVKSKHETFEHIKRIEQSYKENLKVMLLNNVILGFYDQDEEDTIKQLSDCGVRFECDMFKVITIEIDQIDPKWEVLKEQNLCKYAVVNIWDELSEEEYRTFTFYDNNHRIVSITELRHGQEIDEDTYYRLCDLIKKYLGFTITIGVGNICKGLENIRKSYQESLVALENKYILLNQEIILYDKLELLDSNVGFYSIHISEEILVHLRMNEWEEIQKKLKLVQEYTVEKKLSLDYIYVIYMGFVSLCLSYLEEHGGSAKEVLESNLNPFVEIKTKKSVGLLNEWISGIFEKVISYSKANKNTRAKEIALSAKEYINANFSDEEISVESVAKYLYINSSYLRSVFKKEIGLQISKYILNIRMQKSKELLKANYIKIADIASMVGYSDTGYFSKVFKKYYGLSPSEFQNSVKD